MSDARKRQMNVQNKAERNRWAKRAATAALIAGAGVAGTSQQAGADVIIEIIPGFTPGVADGLLNPTDLPFIDIDGDDQDDYQITDNFYGNGVGVDINPLTHNGITNRIFQDGSGQVLRFENPGDVFTADPDDALPNTAYLGSDFSLGGYIGFIFDIPGGSPYFGIIEIADAPSDTSFEITASGFTAVPEPTTMAIVGIGAIALLARRRPD